MNNKSVFDVPIEKVVLGDRVFLFGDCSWSLEINMDSFRNEYGTLYVYGEPYERDE